MLERYRNRLQSQSRRAEASDSDDTHTSDSERAVDGSAGCMANDVDTMIVLVIVDYLDMSLIVMKGLIER